LDVMTRMTLLLGVGIRPMVSANNTRAFRVPGARCIENRVLTRPSSPRGDLDLREMQGFTPSVEFANRARVMNTQRATYHARFVFSHRVFLRRVAGRPRGNQ
jgi:hypothetical protein